MRNIILKSLLVATSLTASAVPTQASWLVDTVEGLVLGHGFNESFYKQSMSTSEKQSVDTALEKVDIRDRAHFKSTFSEFTPYTHPMFTSSIISSAAALPSADWDGYKTFIEDIFEESFEYLQPGTSTSKSHPPFGGVSLSRVMTNLAHYVAADNRDDFLAFFRTQVKKVAKDELAPVATDLTGHDGLSKSDGLSWFIRGLSIVPQGHYDFVAKQAKRMIPAQASLYKKGLMFAALGTLKVGDENALEYAEHYITPELSYEHRSSIITIFGKVDPSLRKTFVTYVDKLSESKDHNYKAWAIQALGVAKTKTELESLYTFLQNTSNQHTQSFNLWDYAIRWKRNQRTP